MFTNSVTLVMPMSRSLPLKLIPRTLGRSEAWLGICEINPKITFLRFVNFKLVFLRFESKNSVAKNLIFNRSQSILTAKTIEVFLEFWSPFWSSWILKSFLKSAVSTVRLVRLYRINHCKASKVTCRVVSITVKLAKVVSINLVKLAKVVSITVKLVKVVSITVKLVKIVRLVWFYRVVSITVKLVRLVGLYRVDH